MGILKGLTDEYFLKTIRLEERLVLPTSECGDYFQVCFEGDDKILRKGVTEETYGYLKKLLNDVLSIEFRLDDYNSLANLFHTLGVKVRICEGILEYHSSGKCEIINEAEKYWKQKLGGNPDLLAPILERLAKEHNWMNTAKIRGQYLREDKIIELYPEEMMDEWKDKGNRIDYLLLSTLFHEAMHAYFDRPGHTSFQYAYFVEEPMAEFGMLLLLKETEMPDVLQQWAHNDVAGKNSCYHYGASLFDQYCAWNKSLRSCLEAYKYGISEYEMLDVDKSGGHVALPFPESKIIP